MRQKMIKTTRTLDEYFPQVDLPEQPLQDWAIVQLKKSFEEGAIDYGDGKKLYISGAKAFDEKGQDEWHQTLAKVIAIGPVFQRNRENLEPWPECADDKNRVSVGDYVRIPEHMSGKFTVQTKDGDAIKCISVRDTQIMRKVINPLDAIERVKNYVPLTERQG